MTDLFTPMDLHGLALPNRIWMSATTRSRASANNIQTPPMMQYYAQRSTMSILCASRWRRLHWTVIQMTNAKGCSRLYF
ncbi:MAG: hypothetical protein JO051_00545 [Acidobacteriaceae bacterium]|nr:hypothetical protein [Acidobacteriaceae bacterium]